MPGVAIVTGASGGIGRAVIRRMVRIRADGSAGPATPVCRIAQSPVAQEI